ncbi:hypothetical protein CDL15_Pgr012794 [Punica granatum]|uniref:Uncharacterized protein n=1 Tax=Punica granatum TaxID=22663 RepID=A0A218XEF0_PUNGR|nr:hypothetical protein CDL15_Pgr012794 [Punica granatum]
MIVHSTESPRSSFALRMKPSSIPFGHCLLKKYNGTIQKTIKTLFMMSMLSNRCHKSMLQDSFEDMDVNLAS